VYKEIALKYLINIHEPTATGSTTRCVGWTGPQQVIGNVAM